MEMASDQDSCLNPETSQLSFIETLLRNEMLPGFPRPGVYPETNAACVIVNSTKISASGRSQRKIGPVRYRGYTGLGLSPERLWDLCSLLYGDERTEASIGFELGINGDSTKKLMRRFIKACEYLGLNLIKTAPGDAAHDTTVSYLLLTSRWGDICQNHMKAVSKKP